VHRIVSFVLFGMVLFGMRMLQKDMTACLPSSHDSPAEPSISHPEADSCADVIPSRGSHLVGSAMALSVNKAMAKPTIHLSMFFPT
jgi:hypothetical protein